MSEEVTFGETKYTADEYEEFTGLYYQSNSSNQMDRINYRLDIKKFIERVGKDKCDEMYKAIQQEENS